MNDLLPFPFGFKLLLRDTGKLQRRTGGAGGNRLNPLLLLLLLRILRTGVFGREMEVLCSASVAVVLVVVVAADDDPEEFNSSCELSLEEEQLEEKTFALIDFH